MQKNHDFFFLFNKSKKSPILHISTYSQRRKECMWITWCDTSSSVTDWDTSSCMPLVNIAYKTGEKHDGKNWLLPLFIINCLNSFICFVIMFMNCENSSVISLICSILVFIFAKNHIIIMGLGIDSMKVKYLNSLNIFKE